MNIRSCTSDWITCYTEYTANTEAPYLYRKWCAISAVASMLQRRCLASIGLITFYPNLYIILVGNSGVRKGTAMGPIRDLLEATGVQLCAESVTREGLIRRLKNSASLPVYDQNTGVLSAPHASLTIHSAEFVVFLGYQNQQLMADLCDWFDCRPKWDYETKTKELQDKISNVWVNLIGATTPSLLQSSLPLDAIGGGLTSRMIFVFAEKKDCKTVPLHFMTQRELDLHRMLSNDLEQMQLMEGQFVMTDDFITRWVPLVNEMESNPPFRDPKFDAYTTRRRGHLIKLAMIMQAARSNDMLLDREILELSWETLREVERKMPMTFSGVGKSDLAPETARIMAIISARKEILFGELLNTFYNDVDEYNMKRIIGTLTRMGFCRQDIHGRDIMVTYNQKMDEMLLDKRD